MMCLYAFGENPLFGAFMLLCWLGGAAGILLMIWGLFMWLFSKMGIDFSRSKENREKRKEVKQYQPDIEAIQDELNSVIAEQDQVLDLDNGYLMMKDWKKVLSKSDSLVKKLEAIPEDVIKQHVIFKNAKALLERHEEDSVLKKRNEKFKKEELARYGHLLNNVNGYPLDAQQRDAVVTDEYNNLVIAGAGSGKTLTIVGKLKYLIEAKGIAPEEILLTSFTRKSVNELASRVEAAGIEGVDCNTFHSIGLNQLSGMGVANDNELKICTLDYLQEGILDKPEQMQAYLEFYGLYKHIPKNPSDYKNIGDQYQEYKSSDLETIKGKLDTMRGERVNSEQELMIANFLYLNGVNYEYEKNYTGDYDKEGHRAYQPDFYLPDYDIWYEHFGIDKDGKAFPENPIKAQKYIDDMWWKRSVHKKNGTKLIESYSYWNDDQDLLNKVKRLLKNNGVHLNSDPEFLSCVYEGLSSDDKYLNSIVKLVTTFLSLAKANDVSMGEIWERGRNAYEGQGYMWHRFELFMTFAESIMAAYKRKLNAENQIDFDDMINMAAMKIRHEGIDKKYKYIIVDEYQDISRSRFGLIQAIREATGAKLMCVGDDWQSIYRFAGSDVSLFTHFEDYVGYAERLKIEQTYRNSQELVNVASRFVEKNPSQIRKHMRSKAVSRQYPVLITQVDDQVVSFEYALDQILDREAGYSGEILILGRHNRDIENVYPGLVGDKDISFWHEKKTGDLRIKYRGYDKIRYLSVHKAKGLEADDVIVLNLVSSLYGFPNRLEDDPILQILLGDPENFEFAEERRLFYVALTRTKNTVALISTTSISPKPSSPFVDELKSDDRGQHILIASLPDSPDEWSPTLCPACGSGRLVVRTNEETGHQFLGCTNYPHCDATYNQLEILEDKVKCPSCGDWMMRRIRKSDRSPFFGCSNYPDCKASYDADEDYNPQERNPIQQAVRTTATAHKNASKDNLRCPKCGGQLVIRTNSKDGSKFYGCSSYPNCKYTRNL